MTYLHLHNFSAVIFDMDGLVLDTEATYFIAWQQAAIQMGYTLSDEFCESLSGLNGDDIKQKLLVQCGADFDLPRFNQIASKAWRNHVNLNGIEIKRGFNELLAFIVQQSLPYCLATNSRAANAFECLELAGLTHVFSTIISRDDVKHGKPAPDIFLKAADTLQVPIQQCLVLEDSHAGVVAAKLAEAFTVFIPSMLSINPLTLELCDVMMSDLGTVLESFRV
jgi:beta-phosphoglucomutase-like phosphatase (HAD superfamily)